MGLLMNPDTFAHVQRVAGMMANSALFPEHLRKGGEKQAIANAVLVFDMAFRMNENPLTVAQNIYFVGGKPAWMTTYIIARANQSGVFSDQIEWEVEGKGEALTVTAFATLAKSGRKAEASVEMAMAKAEGWTSNKKYSSMPERMLRWRAATALIRLYAPEVVIGMPVQIELETGEMRDNTPRETVRHASSEAPIEAEDVLDAAETVSDDAPRNTENDDLAKDAAGLNGKADAEPEQAEANQESDSDPDMERFQHLTDSILRDIGDVEPAGVDDVLELYDGQIKQLESVAPDLHAMVMKAANEKRRGGGQ
ncbi:hypothetical protein D9R08_12010 [Rhodophyticola porphyridii]|uniref:Recombinase RecT n=2 Tax=Rhodophyticola porphyridii TaxID=1852017 RepID=A0A3L9Y775_9RHOB|nr:hypothetical protein D9R08_12010 [Rhodophyticola porphyridii]